MSYLKCYEILGIRPGASRQEIHKAYKRLALRHHPDRTAGDPFSLAVFCRVTEAYTTLKQGLGVQRRGRLRSQCFKCGKPAELFKALDGGRCCATCLLGVRRRTLPLPTFETVRCAAAIVFQVSAVVFTAATAVTSDWRHALAASVFALATLVALTYHVCTADVIDT